MHWLLGNANSGHATCIRAAGGVTSRNNFMVECRKSSVWCCIWCACCRCCGSCSLGWLTDRVVTKLGTGDASVGSKSSGVSRRKPIVNLVSVRIFSLPMIGAMKRPTLHFATLNGFSASPTHSIPVQESNKMENKSRVRNRRARIKTRAEGRLGSILFQSIVAAISLYCVRTP